MTKVQLVFTFIVVFAAFASSERETSAESESSSERELEDDVDEAVGCVQRELSDADPTIAPEVITQVAQDVEDDLVEYVDVDPRSKTGYRNYEFYNAKGFSKANTTDPDVVNAAKTLAQRFSSSDIGEDYYFKVLAIISAERKMVKKRFSNEMEPVFRMMLALQKTDCKKKEVSYSNIDSCNFSDKGYAYRLCKVIEYPQAPVGYIGTRGFQECNLSTKQRIDYITKAVQGTDEVNYPDAEPTKPPR